MYDRTTNPNGIENLIGFTPDGDGVFEHDGVSEWADCADCGAHFDRAVQCPVCGAGADRVGLRVD